MNKYLAALHARRVSNGASVSHAQSDPPKDDENREPGEATSAIENPTHSSEPGPSEPPIFDTSDTPTEPTTAPAAQPMLVEFTNSSNLRSASLDLATGIVTVEFIKSDAYRYANFTAALMIEWQGAKSPGSWFHQHVRSKPDRHPIVAAPTAEG